MPSMLMLSMPAAIAALRAVTPPASPPPSFGTPSVEKLRKDAKAPLAPGFISAVILVKARLKLVLALRNGAATIAACSAARLPAVITVGETMVCVVLENDITDSSYVSVTDGATNSGSALASP